MKDRCISKLCTASASVMLIIMLLSLTNALLPTLKISLAIDQVTGAIWTSDPHGERVDGNLYTNPRDVYLAGGPHKAGAAGLSDGVYYFQITDPSGKTLLSTDAKENRRFTVTDGYISNINPGTHKWNPDTTRGYGIVVQLWPFAYTPSKGGEFKVWVTKVDNYNIGQGNFGFIPSLSKTDNFKVKVNEVSKYFELWITDGISTSPFVTLYVNYTLDTDGNPNTIDPKLPWLTGQLTYDRRNGVYDVFRYPTSFAVGSYIYWQFYVSNTFSWASSMQGPELIDSGGIVNKETLFTINGHKYSYPDNTGLAGWTITLYKDNVNVGETQTDSTGYYEFVGIGSGNFRVCETNKTDEGWAPHGPTCYDFISDGINNGDRTFDFYNYKMLRITDTSDSRYELSSFIVVFTPSNEDPGLYKLSSTNPGSFYVNALKYGEPGSNVRVEVDLPPDHDNADYDSPNFVLHHTYIGSTPIVDVHVYGGILTSPIGGQWVPDWSKDFSNLFLLTSTEDGKHVTVEGNMPITGVVFVTVHIDYQISAVLTWDQVQSFNGFGYIFDTTVYFSSVGVHIRFESSVGVH